MIVDCRPDHLKIDRYIVHGCSADPYRLAVLRSIVTLAQSCAAIPIAEGVEEQRDLEAILDLGIDKVQGWLYGQSMPASAINLERTAS
jgi:EAL domain-containing protein (putative c-di-GMP-specific phosphodiesterase class I)